VYIFSGFSVALRAYLLLYSTVVTGVIKDKETSSDVIIIMEVQE
jgi:hypothetical protein